MRWPELKKLVIFEQLEVFLLPRSETPLGEDLNPGLFKDIHYAIDLSSEMKELDLKLLARHNRPS
jgi:hypothetical protein